MAAKRSKGMTFMEVILAMSLLSLISVLILGTMAMLTRQQVVNVNMRAEANTLATKIMEMQRTRISRSSLAYGIPSPIVPEGTPFTITVGQQLGRLETGVFVPDNGAGAAPNAGVKVDIKLTWDDDKKSVERSCIIVPREN